MKLLKTEWIFKISLACVFLFLIINVPVSAADTDESLAKCAKIRNDAKRLKCFDRLAENTSSSKDTIAIPTQEKDDTSVTAEKKAAKDSASDKTTLSLMEKHWNMGTGSNKAKNIFVFWPYRPCYFLPLAYNSTPNRDAALDFDPDAKANDNEVKFQLSLKYELWRDMIRNKEIQDIIAKNTGIKGMDLWFAYTQLSFWQLYNKAFSAPFRDTNYEPEMLLNFRIQQEIPYLTETKLQFINIGFNHQSNGRSEPLSRSWNRIVANVGFEKYFGPEKKDAFELLIKTWYRLPEDEEEDDNPDLIRYMGYGELWGTLYWKNQRFALMLRNNLRSENKGAVQLEWSIPLSSIHEKLAKNFSLYVQYFNGYGESLLDYNKSINRISAGIMLADWN